jgi:hypothetical protein
MAIVPLAKPGTLGTAVLQIVRSNNTLTQTMQIKLQACDIDYSQTVEDTTGASSTDADDYHTAEGSGLLGGSIALQGLLMSTSFSTGDAVGTPATTVVSQFIGINNMFALTDTLSRMRWSVGLASGIFLKGSMVVEKCRVRWVRTASTVQITIMGRITDTDPGVTEAIVAITVVP